MFCSYGSTIKNLNKNPDTAAPRDDGVVEDGDIKHAAEESSHKVREYRRK